MSAHEIVPQITHIINFSVQKASFLSLYKIAQVKPLFMKDDPREAKSYRPVANICIVSKIIERAIFMQIVDYMCKNSLFNSNHHGFRVYHSTTTTTAMVQMYDSWVQEADDKIFI